MTLKKPIYILAITMASWLALEILLWFFDPLGVILYQRQIMWNIEHYETTGQNYRLPVGVHAPPYFTVIIDGKGNRIVPNSYRNDCTIAFIGDSVTFGHGVNDNQTFANIIALQFPDVYFVNAARPGYNQTQITDEIRLNPADAYIYLIIYNDATVEDALPYGKQMAWSALYMYLRSFVPAKHRYNWERYDTVLREIDTKNSLIFGFQDEAVSEHAAGIVDVSFIPLYTETNSRADFHPDADGHRQIAYAMLGDVEKLIKEVC